MDTAAMHDQLPLLGLYANISKQQGWCVCVQTATQCPGSKGAATNMNRQHFDVQPTWGVCVCGGGGTASLLWTWWNCRSAQTAQTYINEVEVCIASFLKGRLQVVLDVLLCTEHTDLRLGPAGAAGRV